LACVERRHLGHGIGTHFTALPELGGRDGTDRSAAKQSRRRPRLFPPPGGWGQPPEDRRALVDWARRNRAADWNGPTTTESEFGTQGSMFEHAGFHRTTTRPGAEARRSSVLRTASAEIQFPGYGAGRLDLLRTRSRGLRSTTRLSKAYVMSQSPLVSKVDLRVVRLLRPPSIWRET
jgi:hypothetical protein